MSEDLLDLGSLGKSGSNLSVSNAASNPASPAPSPNIASNTSALHDLWGLGSPPQPSTTTIPRFTEAPPADPSPPLFSAPLAHSSPSPTSSPAPAPLSQSSSASTLSQLQDLWFPPNTLKPSSGASLPSEQPSQASQSHQLPPVMSPSPAPSDNDSDAPQEKAESQAAPSSSPNTSHSRQSSAVSTESDAHSHLGASGANSLTNSSSANNLAASKPPPFQIWSPAPSQESSQPQSPSAYVAHPNQETKYSVTTIANPPGTVEQESFTVMKDMLKTMSDMTRRMLTMEERITRLEMEKEQLSRTVNRLQETQHQQMIRQEAPKPTHHVPQVAYVPPSGYPSGYPPGYGSVTSTYQVPSYGAPVARYDPVKRI